MLNVKDCSAEVSLFADLIPVQMVFRSQASRMNMQAKMGIIFVIELQILTATMEMSQ